MFDDLFEFDVTSVTEIKEGFSIDKKYIVNGKYLVRVINKDREDRFKFVFETQKKFQEIALCQKAIDLVLGENESYYITEYLPGKNGLKVINEYTTQQQYDFGVEAARELVTFHNANVVTEFDSKTNVENYFNAKVETAKINEVELMVPEINELIEIVRDNLHYLYDLRGVLTHSDYHLFNMIFDKGTYKGVIDFERCRISHFLTDFRNNTPHNSRVSPYFASGYIDGYLDLVPTDKFFKKYNVHDLMMSIAAIPWIMEFNPDNLEKDIAMIKNIFEDVKDIKNRPKWYVGRY